MAVPTAPKAASRRLASHTILIIDKSGSMRNADVQPSAPRAGTAAERVPISRNEALFDVLFRFLTHQEENGDHGPDDVYSLVTFSEAPSVQFTHQTLRSARKFLLEVQAVRPASHGNYVPVLSSLSSLLSDRLSLTSAATMVLFMTDGKPSDPVPRGPGDSNTKLLASVCEAARDATASAVAGALAGRSIFSFHAMGFGPASDFSIVAAMAAQFPNGFGCFHHAALDVKDLRRAVEQFSSSLTESRLSSKQIGTARPLREVRVDRSNDCHATMRLYNGSLFECPDDVAGSEWHKRIEDCDVRISEAAFGAGGERNAFMLEMVGDQAKYVAKEDKHVSNSKDELTFHKQKLVAQKLSKRVAELFNTRLAALPRPRGTLPYSIRFPFSFLLRTTTPMQRTFFVERYISGTLVKWNSNSGYVRKSPTKAVASLLECSDEEDDDYDERRHLEDSALRGGQFEVEDVPQAFSHWSYVNSTTFGDERFLVCDVQGFYDKPRRIFELIDPVIHSGERETTYARTDHGPKGIDKFFSTHCCNSLCHALHLPVVLPDCVVCGQRATGKCNDCNNAHYCCVRCQQQHWHEHRHSCRASGSTSTSASIPTSAIPVVKTHHLQQRQLERDIVTKELQRAVKHGEKAVQRDGVTIKHTHEGVSYITDKMGQVGITGYRSGPQPRK